MRYRLEHLTTDEVLIISLIAEDDEGRGEIQSEIAIPLESLHPQGRAAKK